MADHRSLDNLRQQLQRALANRELEDTRTKLDLFWARLAVHIRAEHLHLFPVVLNSMGNEQPAPVFAPTTAEAEALIATLQSDHDFFMSELASAVKIIRSLPAASDPSGADEALHQIRRKVEGVCQRLLTHNEIEENQIYRWVSMVLTIEEQVELERRICAELNKRPARFTVQAWSNVAE